MQPRLPDLPVWPSARPAFTMSDMESVVNSFVASPSAWTHTYAHVGKKLDHRKHVQSQDQARLTTILGRKQQVPLSQCAPQRVVAGLARAGRLHTCLGEQFLGKIKLEIS